MKFILISTLLSITFTATSAATAQDYTDCSNLDTHYSSLPSDKSQWTSESLGNFLLSKHRNRLPYTSTSFDVWDALIDLDAGSEPNTVSLIYKNQEVRADLYGTSDTWNREHLWPKSLGVGTSGHDYTDIHALRPSDWNVNSARGNKFFGECGIADVEEDCISPAHIEADVTTSTDGVIWNPPENVRGDIARAMFYMETRYFGADGTTDPDLELVDCPNATNVNELAYKSVLLQWHEADPVSIEEVNRNNRACQHWQGNRNPFVDYPDLVTQIYGLPREQPTDGQGYNCDSTFSPTPVPSPSPVVQGCNESNCHLCDKENCQLLTGGCKWSSKEKACINSNPAPSPTSPTPVPQPTSTGCPYCGASRGDCCGTCVESGKPSDRGCFNRRNLRA